MNLPPFLDRLLHIRSWARANPTQAQIAAITAGAIGLIVIMFLVTIVVIIGLLR
jgi:hypothetical protein